MSQFLATDFSTQHQVCYISLTRCSVRCKTCTKLYVRQVVSSLLHCQRNLMYLVSLGLTTLSLCWHKCQIHSNKQILPVSQIHNVYYYIYNQGKKRSNGFNSNSTVCCVSISVANRCRFITVKCLSIAGYFSYFAKYRKV